MSSPEDAKSSRPPPVAEAVPPQPEARGVALSYAERLRWLERAKRDFGRLLGRARGEVPADLERPKGL